MQATLEHDWTGISLLYPTSGTREHQQVTSTWEGNIQIMKWSLMLSMYGMVDLLYIYTYGVFVVMASRGHRSNIHRCILLGSLIPGSVPIYIPGFYQ
jgi:hypothetical protein